MPFHRVALLVVSELNRLSLRACSRSIEKEDEEGEVNELQAGIEPSFAVFHSLWFFSNQAKERSTTQPFVITAKVWSPLRLTTWTVSF